MGKLSADAQKRAEMLLIDTYRESRDLDHAIAETKKALEAAPNDPSLTVTLAMLYGEKSDADAATKLLDGLLKRKRQRPGNLFEPRAGAGTRQEVRGSGAIGAEGRADGAREMTIKRRRGSCWARFTSGRRNSIRRSRNSAKRWTVNPGNASVLNYYGYMLADRGVRLEEATAMIKQAVTQEPSNGAYLDSLGWAYYKQNKLTEAEENLRKACRAAEARPDDSGASGRCVCQAGTERSGRDLLGTRADGMAEGRAGGLRIGQGERAGRAAEESETAHGAKNHAGFGETAVSSPA